MKQLTFDELKQMPFDSRFCVLFHDENDTELIEEYDHPEIDVIAKYDPSYHAECYHMVYTDEVRAFLRDDTWEIKYPILVEFLANSYPGDPYMDLCHVLLDPTYREMIEFIYQDDEVLVEYDIELLFVNFSTMKRLWPEQTKTFHPAMDKPTILIAIDYEDPTFLHTIEKLTRKYVFDCFYVITGEYDQTLHHLHLDRMYNTEFGVVKYADLVHRTMYDLIILKNVPRNEVQTIESLIKGDRDEHWLAAMGWMSSPWLEPQTDEEDDAQDEQTYYWFGRENDGKRTDSTE